MKVSVRWIQVLWSRSIPDLRRLGRPGKEISEEEAKVVVDAFTRYKLGAVCLEKIIDARFNIHRSYALAIGYNDRIGFAR